MASGGHGLKASHAQLGGRMRNLGPAPVTGAILTVTMPPSGFLDHADAMLWAARWPPRPDARPLLNSRTVLRRQPSRRGRQFRVDISGTGDRGTSAAAHLRYDGSRSGRCARSGFHQQLGEPHRGDWGTLIKVKGQRSKVKGTGRLQRLKDPSELSCVEEPRSRDSARQRRASGYAGDRDSCHRRRLKLRFQEVRPTVESTRDSARRQGARRDHGQKSKGKSQRYL